MSTGLTTGGSEARLRPSVPSNADASDEGSWQYYGGDAGGSRYSPLDEINRDNVTRLGAAWEYRTGDYSDGSGGMRESKFEATPILFGGKLIFSTPFSRIIALDPATGREVWMHDPEIDLYQRYSESSYHAESPPGRTSRPEPLNGVRAAFCSLPSMHGSSPSTRTTERPASDSGEVATST